MQRALVIKLTAFLSPCKLFAPLYAEAGEAEGNRGEKAGRKGCSRDTMAAARERMRGGRRRLFNRKKALSLFFFALSSPLYRSTPYRTRRGSDKNRAGASPEWRRKEKCGAFGGGLR
jgi:hypothetical protein